MKLFATLAAIILTGIIASDARAQETNGSLNNEANGYVRNDQQRTPTMVVYEARVTTEAAKTPAAATPDLKGGAATKDAAGKPEGSAAAPAKSPALIVVPPASLTSAKLDTSGNPVYDELVLKAAARYGVDPNLIFAVMRQESGFNSRARSYKGASGLMQLMPATARRFGVTNIFDPAQNIDGGVKYLRFLLDMFEGDVELALAGYNAGEGAVVRSGYRVPNYRETKHYVKVISARYGRSKHKASAKPQAPAAPVAPDAMTFSGGISGRLSNNY